MDLEREFRREYTQLARLFREVIDFVCEEHIHRIAYFLDYWEPLLETMAGVIEEKGEMARRSIHVLVILYRGIRPDG